MQLSRGSTCGRANLSIATLITNTGITPIIGMIFENKHLLFNKDAECKSKSSAVYNSN
jgi:hypothetical protein